jgi:hypothetical protein
MNDDPIVAEVRRIRDELARRFNYDVHAIFADLRARQGLDNPSHPLVTDASEWHGAMTEKDALVLREDPPRFGKSSTEKP